MGLTLLLLSNHTEAETYKKQTLYIFNWSFFVQLILVNLKRAETTLNTQTFAINPFEVQNIPRLSEPSNEREAFYQLQNLSRNGLLDLELTNRNLSTLENNELLMNVLGDRKSVV